MPRTPGTLLSPTPTRRGLKDALLFHLVGRDLNPAARTGQVPLFTRASAGGAVLDRNGRYVVPVHSQPRYEMVDLDGDGIRETAGLVLEPTRTNLATWSSDFANAAWAGASDFALANAVSVIAGQVAQRHTNNNAAAFRARTQTVGVLSAAGDTVYTIVENVDADTTAIALFDVNLGTSVHLATFTWSSRTLASTTGTGKLFALKLAEAGPNGGPVYLIGVSGIGTAGNSRRLLIYPSGTTQNGKIAIVHHGQLEAGDIFPSSPIVTGAASAARARDSLEYPFPARIQDLTAYLRFVSRGTEGNDAVSRVFLGIGTVSANSRLTIGQGGGATTYTASLGDTGGGVATAGLSNTAVGLGEVVELMVQLRVAAARTGTVQLTAVIDGVAAASAVSASRAVSELFSGSELAIGAIPDATTVDAAGTYLEVKVAAGILTLDQIREAQS